MKKKYRLLSWNVNGIRAVEKKGFIPWLKADAPDVLCLQETKAQPDQLSEELKNVESYNAEFCWGERKGYSGVGTYSRHSPIKVERGLGIKEFDQEGRVLIHHFKEFVLFNVYFPNGKARAERLKFKMDFYDSFLKTLQKYRKKGMKNLVVCGDVNTAHKEIDLARPKENSKVSGFLPEERAWMDKLLEADFIDTLRHFDDAPGRYTWWDMISRARSRNVGWRIDYFFVSSNMKKNLEGASIHDHVMGSDHCPIELSLKF
jgi:exodeoxyribonuclease-3